MTGNEALCFFNEHQQHPAAQSSPRPSSTRMRGVSLPSLSAASVSSAGIAKLRAARSVLK